MAVRRPLILDGSNNLIEMTDAQRNAIRDRVRYLYGSDPSVTLSRVSSGGNLGSIDDTRKKSGTSHTSTTGYPSESTTGEPGTVTVSYARISETRANTSASSDTNNIAFPVYQSSGNIYAMSLTDMYDTFIYPAIDTITGAVGQPGTYRIHTGTSLSGYTAVSTSAVFSDTRADVSEYLASNIGGSGTTQDISETITNFYLLKANNISAPSVEKMLYVRNSDKNLQQYTDAQIDVWLKNSVRHAASEITGTKIDYRLGESVTGTTLGSGITNTILNGSGNKQERFVNADDYRAQEFPNGTAITANTYYLKMTQE